MEDESQAGLVRATSDLSIASTSASSSPSTPSTPSLDSQTSVTGSSPAATPDGSPAGTASRPSIAPTKPAATGGPGVRMASGGPPSFGSGANGFARRPGGGPSPSMGASGGPGSNSFASINDKARQLASTRLPPSLQAKLAANANRSSSSTSSQVLGHDQRLDSASFLNAIPAGGTAGLSARMNGMGMGGGGPPPSLGGRAVSSPAAPGIPPVASRTAPPPPGGMKRNKPGLKLSDMGMSASPEPAGASAARPTIGASANPSLRGGAPGRLAVAGTGPMSNAFANFSSIVDTSGRLNFDGKAVLHASGVEFGNGTSFKINMEDLELGQELGQGNYGTVRKVRHTRTMVDMAMKEIRLELDRSKLDAIIMELDILHRATAPQIVDFYGAFFIESCVYYCMELMDAGGLDKLCKGMAMIPEDVLARVTGSMVKGLRFLKDELQIMHRDVKPTNVLVNKKGEVKLCDFGVSGQLEKSLAKTNIGCQSYMAPERIKGESQNRLNTYTVASDVWSLGLSIVEMTVGTYPYPPETYSNVFAQLQAIVHGDAPLLPGPGKGPCEYSEAAQDFVAGCLEKNPERRPTYAQMLRHPFLVADDERGDSVDMRGWVVKALENAAKLKAEVEATASVDGSAPPPIAPVSAPPP